MSMICGARNKIKLVIHSINEKDVYVSTFSVRNLVSGCSTAAVAVSRLVVDAHVCFGFDDHPGNTCSIRCRNNQKLAQQVTSNTDRIAAQKKTFGNPRECMRHCIPF